MEQKHTSANTSINKTKLPAVYNNYNFEYGSRVLDYGCGKYTDHIKEKMNKLGCEWHGYDKYNQSDLVNNETETYMKMGFDVGICANVLNVIDNIDTIKEIIKDVKDCCNIAVFSIYEGNKSGVGSETKKDCYQRNETIDDYVELMKKMGYNPIKQGKMITIQ